MNNTKCTILLMFLARPSHTYIYLQAKSFAGAYNVHNCKLIPCHEFHSNYKYVPSWKCWFHNQTHSCYLSSTIFFIQDRCSLMQFYNSYSTNWNNHKCSAEDTRGVNEHIMMIGNWILCWWFFYAFAIIAVDGTKILTHAK